jgi:hypothetical protein
VLFGQPFEEDRYWHVIEDSHLPPDLQLLVDGDLMEVRCMVGSDVLIFPSADFFAVL